MAFKGKAPLTFCRSVTGGYVYVYEGQIAPNDLAEGEVERLVEEGYLEEVADEPADDSPKASRRPTAKS